MKAQLCILFFFLARVLFCVDFHNEDLQQKRADEGRRFYQKCLENAEVYQKVDGCSIKDITDELDDPRLQETGRRIALFQYPSDGLLIKGYISYVDAPDDKPLLVFLRGGNEIFGLMHPVTSFSLLSHYTVLATCYRGGVSEGSDEFGGADVADVYNLVQHIPTLERELNMKIGREKRFLMGGSRGGLEMFLALNRYPQLQEYFDGAISLCGLLNLQTCVSSRPDMRRMFQSKFGYTDNSWLEMRDPISNIDQIQSDFPLLVIQGTEDRRVCLEEGRSMVEALKNRGCTVEYVEVEGGGHCLQNKCEEREQILLKWLAK